VLLTDQTLALTLSCDELALAGRPVPPATTTVAPRTSELLLHLRACYERALLPVLRERADHLDLAREAGASPHASINGPIGSATLDDCLTQLAESGASDPYDFWRLAIGCLRALRRDGQAHSHGENEPHNQAPNRTQIQRLYARFNLVLADQLRGSTRAPRSLVRLVLALLWREYALHGVRAAENVDAADNANDLEQVELLRDYGLNVAWRVAGSQSSAALWDTNTAVRSGPDGQYPAPGVTATRDIGSLRVDADAFEDFLQTADAAIAALSIYATAPRGAAQWDAGAAWQAADAAYRLGACAWALSLGGVALLADALGLAWRRLAHAAARQPQGLRIDARVLESGAHALRGMLHQIAAGMPPAHAPERLAELTGFIEADF
jgi:hypothetical protein